MLQRKYKIPEKPILLPDPRRRRLRREGAIADLQQLGSGNTITTTQQLKREDSFILVDYGNHFRMVKPAYAVRYFHLVPENFQTVAPYHSLGPSLGEQELKTRLLAVPIVNQNRKRVRFVEEEEDPGEVDSDEARPRKRRRLS